MHTLSYVLETKQNLRLGFIDFTRGFVMIIMAWDHVSGFWNPGKMGGEGLGGNFPRYTDLVQFLLRFMTHVCAPTFLFLAGTSLAISTWKRRSRGESEFNISKRMVIRGIILLILSHYIVGPSFGMRNIYFGVIACIGVCFILFSIGRKISTIMILVLSIIIILFNQYINLNWLPNEPFWTILKIIIHDPGSSRTIGFSGLYPVLPWIGVMGLGWCFGDYLTKNYWNDTHKLVTPLTISGVISICVFIIVRWINGYGNLVNRSGTSIIAWLSISKYPPSIAYLLSTLGLMSLILAIGLKLETAKSILKAAVNIVKLFGQTALFFYMAHLPLYRNLPSLLNIKRYSLNLSGVAVFWVLGLCLLWGLCKVFLKIKRRYSNSLLQYI